jgi:hypothetical protein
VFRTSQPGTKALVAWGFVVPFAFGAFLAAMGVVVLTQVEEELTPRRSLPILGDVTE